MATFLALVLQVGTPWSASRATPPLVIHVTHDPRSDAAARLARIMEKMCARAAAAKCRVAPPLEATTFLHVSAETIIRKKRPRTPLDDLLELDGEVEPEEPAASLPTVRATIYIQSQVMLPGSISARDTSLERLAVTLLASLWDRQAQRAGVIELP
jgi:hypothetical protein